jgi:16S rRNA (guanine527-N7)-methyltransferase
MRKSGSLAQHDISFDAFERVAENVSRETFQELLSFQESFFAWNGRINLVAASTEVDFWRRHILDSAQLWRLAPTATKWIDIGSGGGLPGLVIAFLLKGRGNGAIDLVESNRKKAGFLQTMIGQYDLPAKAYPIRIEDAAALATLSPEIVTARALAPLPRLFPMIYPWISMGSRALLHKGRDYRAEVEESTDQWQFDLIEHPSVTDADAVILEVSHLGRRI